MGSIRSRYGRQSAAGIGHVLGGLRDIDGLYRVSHITGQLTALGKNGVRATQFRPEIDAGNGYLKGATTLPVVVRTAYLDDPATNAIAQRALALRKAEGTLSGHALGEDTE
ncbi:hypothetical protein GCM10010271_15090 [Streptomyces kurssanovii]|nr:hypothetical protein GCM10010271_15090 [Streptomyces kurssanovii]